MIRLEAYPAGFSPHGGSWPRHVLVVIDVSRKLFFVALLEPRMKLKSDHALLSIVLGSVPCNSIASGAGQPAPRIDMKSAFCVLSHVLFVELIINMENTK